MLLALAKMFKTDNIPSVGKRKGLTQVELLAVVGIVTFAVLLLLLVLPRMSRPYRQAPGVACMANLKQWGLVFDVYKNDHDGNFVRVEGGENGQRWFEPFHSLYKNEEIWFCPTATKPYVEGGRNPFGAWKVGKVSGSYGLNGWVCNSYENTELNERVPIENYWGTTVNVQCSDIVPMLADAMWFEAQPRYTDLPSPFEEWPGEQADYIKSYPCLYGMRCFNVNRHKSYVNVLFMDYSVRKVGLKELWTLKWHRNYDVAGPWTKAGGVPPDDWPLWMQDFKDY